MYMQCCTTLNDARVGDAEHPNCVYNIARCCTLQDWGGGEMQSILTVYTILHDAACCKAGGMQSLSRGRIVISSVRS